MGVLGRALLSLGLQGHPVSSVQAAAQCIIQRFDLPVVMEGLRPVLTAQINGANVRFVVDSGAFYSMLSPAAAKELNLPQRAAPFGFHVTGIGGSVTPAIATAKLFALGGVPFRNAEFLVGGTDVGAGAAGLLGENLMRLWDLEFDLANGMIRIVKPEHCGDRPMAYWATSQPFAIMQLQYPTALSPQPVGWARVNGKEIRVGLDTGATMSMLTLRGAHRAGITPASAGITAAGSGSGIGRKSVRVWIAPIDSFKIDDEEIQHTRLRIADVDLGNIEMLLGEDFFLSHHIYVSHAQHKAYITYNGGPVFRLDDALPASDPQVASAGQAPTAAAPEPVATGSPAPSPDVAELIRRGTAYAARRDFAHALSDLTRACQLAPEDPDCFYELGRIYAQNRQKDLALQNIDRALQLKHDHVFALLARAELHMPARDAVQPDLDTLDRVLPAPDNARLPVAQMYERIGAYPAAIHDFDLWIDTHGEDARLAGALNGRCWARAEANQDLDGALKDCNRAMRLHPDSAALLDSRGLVYLRRGELDRSIADYDAALKLSPKSAPSLYGRGLAKLAKGLDAEGRADLAAAAALDKNVALRFAGVGLKPP